MNVKRYTAYGLTNIISSLFLFASIIINVKVSHYMLAPFYGDLSANVCLISGLVCLMTIAFMTIDNIKYKIHPFKIFDKKTRTKTIISFCFVVLFGMVLIALTKYFFTYGHVDGEQLLYCLIAGTNGMDMGVVTDIAYPAIKFGLIFSVYFTFVYFTACNLIKVRKMNDAEYVEKHKIIKKIPTFVSVIAILMIIIHTLSIVPIVDFVYYQLSKPSTFIEDNYTDPKTTNIIAPEQKRNLIHIYVESMENSFADKESGGAFSENMIPNITRLSKEHISFSNTDKLGGALETYGMTFTTAGMVGYAFGIPLKVQNNNILADTDKLLPGLYSLYDIFSDNGYKNYGLMGSDAAFGGKKALYTAHGDVTIFDYYHYALNGSLPLDEYPVFWGFDDRKAYEFAKQEITKIATDDEPFCFVLETIDTHVPDGYKCPDCGNEFDSQYSNVVACADKKIGDFVAWAQEQEWYDNTTIVITGDHLTMKQDYFVNVDPSYTRTVTNIIINPDPSLQYDKSVLHNRLFSGADMFPTILTAMGYKIDGNKLGVGVNLFSGEKTLYEQYGYDYVNDEFKKKSSFFVSNFDKK